MKQRAVLVALLAVCLASPARSQDLGTIDFPTSGSPAAQPHFIKGVLLMHSFEYDDAREAFVAAQQDDAGFAMAYWGEAMTYNHPVWMAQDAAAGRAALARLGPTPQARQAKARSARERAYLAAVEALYGEGTKEARDQAYSDRMRALHLAHPDDTNARAFYALSLLGLAHQGRDHMLYMRAAGLLEEIFPENQHHPGVLHYLIHSYDDPEHAPLGLRAARLYGQVAPDAGHALHMTTHIFLPLGMWDEVVAANVAAMDVVNRERAAAGRPPMHCHHYSEWQVYGEYQRGRSSEADAQVARCRADAVAELARPASGAIEPVRSAVRSYAGMAVRRLIETGAWDGSDALGLPQNGYLAARFTLAYGDLLAAGSAPDRIRAARARLQDAHARWLAAGGESPAAARRAEIILMQAEALVQLAEGNEQEGLATLRAAADRERTIPAEFGPPLIEKPSHELLADALVRLGRAAEARQFYRSALALAPGRRLAVRGAGD